MDECRAALEFRHACKIFDTSRKIEDEDLLYILEATRLSPSSFGMEPWRFLVIENQQIKKELQPLCWNQKQITTCSHLVVIKNQTGLVQDDEYIWKMFKRRGLDEEATKAYIQKYKSFLKLQDIDCWTSKQCYIAMETMLLAAAFKKIDSCPIEGFEREKVEEYLGLDSSKERVAIIVALGYRLKEAPKKNRLPLEELVEFR